MFTDLMKFLSELIVSFRTVFRIASVPAGDIPPQKEHIKLNFGALIVAVVLYYLVCSLLYSYDFAGVSIFDSFFVNFVFVLASIFVVFLVSVLTAILDGSEAADLRADQWTTLFTYVWIVSLALITLDLLLGILVYQPIGYMLSATLSKTPSGGNVVRSVFYTLAAVFIVFLRSKFVLKRRVFSPQALFSGVAALVFNSAFLFVMVYQLPGVTARLS